MLGLWYNNGMFLTDLISWWYFRGWGIFLANFKRKLGDTADMFSFGDMLRTLFKPYRQISAGAADSDALDARISAFFDRLVSRIVGMFARLTIIFAGIIVMILECVLGILMLVLWPVVPVLPAFGIILMVVGVTL